MPDSPIRNATLPLVELHPHPRNYRKHPDLQIQRLRASLRRFGQVRSVVVQQGAPGRYLIVAGHGLVEAARAEEYTSLRADIIPADWTPDMVTGYLVADNLTAATGDDDGVVLAQLLEEQKNAGFPLESMGFSDEALQVLLDDLAEEALAGGSGRSADDPGGGGDDFDATPADGPTRAQVGDLWQLGNHRLLVGDATVADRVERLMDGDSAQMVFTDPPYGVSYVGKTAKALTIQNDTMDVQALHAFLASAFSVACTFCDAGAAWYVAAPAGPQLLAFAQVLTDLGIWRQSITWVKQSLVLGHSDYHYRHEQIFYGWTPGAAHYFVPDRSQDTVWEIDRPTASREHPTMKPLSLVAKALENSSKSNDIVFDGFGGSGTTLIACERLGRRARLCEIDPHYADVIMRRYEEESGDEAHLLSRLAVAA